MYNKRKFTDELICAPNEEKDNPEEHCEKGQVRFCRICGVKLFDDSIYCHRCGEKVKYQ